MSHAIDSGSDSDSETRDSLKSRPSNLFSSCDKRSAIIAELLALEYTFYLMIGRVVWLDHMVANVAAEVDQDLSSATAAIDRKQRVTWLVLLFEQQKYFPLFLRVVQNFPGYSKYLSKRCVMTIVYDPRKSQL